MTAYEQAELIAGYLKLSNAYYFTDNDTAARLILDLRSSLTNEMSNETFCLASKLARISRGL